MKKKYFISLFLVLALGLYLLLSPTHYSQLKNEFIEYSFNALRIAQKRFEFHVINPISELCIFQSPKMSRLRGVCDHPSKSSCFIRKDILENKIKSGLPDWAKQQIAIDLAKLETFSSIDLDNYFKKYDSSHNALVRFKIKDGEIVHFNSLEELKPKFKNANDYFDPRIKAFSYILKYLVQNNYIADSDFIISLSDYVIRNDSDPVPLFTFAKDLAIPGEKDLILIPDWHNFSSLPALMPKIRKANTQFPWKNKQTLLFWRGGNGLDSTGFRHKIVEFSLLHPNKIDAKFLNTPNYVEPEEHLNYKYLISIDGGRCSFERFIWHLHSNSLTFKHNSTQVQWYYNGIKPFVHYIPVNNEADILAKMAWAESHPAEVQSIINNAYNFVEQNLELEDLYHYVAVLLQEYNKKLKNQYQGATLMCGNLANTREIERIPATPKLTPKLIQLLCALCFKEDSYPLPYIDYIYILGSSISFAEILEVFKSLVNEKVSENILITGGIVNYNDSQIPNLSQAEMIYDYIKSNIPNSYTVLLEKRAQHTLENVVFGLELLEKQPESLCFIGKSYHAGRAMLTFQKYLPYAKIYQRNVDPIYPEQKVPMRWDNWHINPYFSSLVWGEFLRIKKYGERGDISYDSVKDLILEIENNCGA